MLLKTRTITSTQGNDYVDFGFPSGLLWARCNIGADEPYEYGDYFMWGSTEPNTHDCCEWKTSPFNDYYYNGYYYEFNEKYFTTIQSQVCPNGILAPEYDAASIIMGDGWRLPTEDEFQELIDNTEHEWVENYQYSGINGMIFKANNNELFIPASGYRDGPTFIHRGGGLYLWSSSIIADLNGALGFKASDYFFCNINDCDRSYGFCLRGVKEI